MTLKYVVDTMEQEIQGPCLSERDKCRIRYSSEWTQRREAFLIGEKPPEIQKELEPLFL
jgi:hypothetical protein